MKMEEVMERWNHLPEETINEIIRDYDNGVALLAISRTYGLQCNASQLERLLPPRETEKLCIYCHTKMMQRRSRSEDNPCYCPNCHHIDSPKCNCDTCQQRRLQILREQEEVRIRQETEKKQRIMEYWTHDDIQENSADDLTTMQKVEMGLVLNYFSQPHDFRLMPLCSTQSEEKKIISDLLIRNLITVVPEKSDMNGFCNDIRYICDLKKICFKENISFSTLTTREDLINGNIQVSESEFGILWRWICIQDLKCVLRFILTDRGYDFAYTSEMGYLFYDSLNRFSVSQCVKGLEHSFSKIRFQNRTDFGPLAVQEQVLKIYRGYFDYIMDNGYTLNGEKEPWYLANNIARKYIYELLELSTYGYTVSPSRYRDYYQKMIEGSNDK